VSLARDEKAKPVRFDFPPGTPPEEVARLIRELARRHQAPAPKRGRPRKKGE